MKKVIISALVLVGVLLAFNVFAFEAYVGGHKTVATPNHVVIGGVVYEVKLPPTNEQERSLAITWIEAQIYDLQTQLAHMEKDVCAK